MVLLYILFSVYIVAVNIYSVLLLISQRNDIATDDKPVGGDSKLILAALFGGSVAIYITMFILRYKLKNPVLMILLPIIAVFNVWLTIVAFRSGMNIFVA